MVGNSSAPRMNFNWRFFSWVSVIWFTEVFLVFCFVFTFGWAVGTSIYWPGWSHRYSFSFLREIVDCVFVFTFPMLGRGSKILCNSSLTSICKWRGATDNRFRSFNLGSSNFSKIKQIWMMWYFIRGHCVHTFSRNYIISSFNCFRYCIIKCWLKSLILLIC